MSGGLRSQAAVGVVPPRLIAACRVIFASQNGRTALAAMAISQATMVAVMTMTPVHLKAHGHEGVSPLVISLHIAGMYAFSPLIGRFCDKRGRFRAITIGSCLLVVASVLAALAGDAAVLIFPALWLLGIGWSFGLIGGSSLLVDSVPTDARVSVQGAADLMMSLCGGLAGFSSGFVRKAVGFHMLANFAAVLAISLVVVATRALGREAKTAVAISS